MYNIDQVYNRLEFLATDHGQQGQDWIEESKDTWLFCRHASDLLGQFGYLFKGFVCRQSAGNVVMSIKVLDSGTPLVGFVTSSSTTGCIRVFLDLLQAEKIDWHKDKYPWV